MKFGGIKELLMTSAEVSADRPFILAADVDDLLEGSLVDDGPDFLRVTLTEVDQDLTERSRHLGRQVGAGVVVGKHPDHLWQHLLHFRRRKHIKKVCRIRRCGSGSEWIINPILGWGK